MNDENYVLLFERDIGLYFRNKKLMEADIPRWLRRMLAS